MLYSDGPRNPASCLYVYDDLSNFFLLAVQKSVARFEGGGGGGMHKSHSMDSLLLSKRFRHSDKLCTDFPHFKSLSFSTKFAV